MEGSAVRADYICEGLDMASLDGGITVLSGIGVNDLLVHQDTVRDVDSVIASWAATRGMPTLVYSAAQGVRAKIAPNGPRARVPSGIDIGTPPSIAFDVLFESLMREDVPTALVIQFAEGLLPDDHAPGYRGDSARMVEQLAQRTSDPTWRAAGHRIVLVCRTESIDVRLLRMPGVTQIDLTLPDSLERLSAFQLMCASPRHPLVLDEGLEVLHAARLAGGLTVDDVSRLRFRSSVRRPLTDEMVLERSNQAIAQAAGDTLIVHKMLTSLEAEFAGMPQLRLIIDELLDGGTFGTRMVLGGPPGGGKSLAAKALGYEFMIPVVELGRIQGRYVGESQENLKRAFDSIWANLPLILLIDEIDQTILARRSEEPGDGSTITADLRSETFKFLGDVGEADLGVVGMTNRIDLLDEASADRFMKVPVLYADHREGAHVLAIQARREERDLDVDGAAEALQAAGDVFSGRQLVRLLESAKVWARAAGRTRIAEEDIAWALTDTRERIGPAEKLMTLMAVSSTSFNRHLPWNAARVRGDQFARPPKDLEPFVFTDGTLDDPVLDAHIREQRSGVR